MEKISWLDKITNVEALRTERYGDTEKGCQKPAVQQKTTDDNSQSSVPHFCSLLPPKQIPALHWALSTSISSALTCTFSFSFLLYQ